LIKPLRIVDEAKEWLFVGSVRKQTEQRESDEKTVGAGPRAHAEGCSQRVALRWRQRLEPVEQWRTQLVHPREGKLHLRLNPE
jgi:hypothetical protein